ncbi:hypothetical protein CR513_62048, partial [Mucuna pruriens]
MLSHEQLLEFWHGLLSSMKPLLWVIIRKGLIDGEGSVDNNIHRRKDGERYNGESEWKFSLDQEIRKFDYGHNKVNKNNELLQKHLTIK